MIDFSVAFDYDYQAIASPLPHPIANIMAVVQPFGMVVWIAIFATAILMTSSFYLVTTKEGEFDGLIQQAWPSFLEALWFSFGTQVSQAMTQVTHKHQHANGLR